MNLTNFEDYVGHAPGNGWSVVKGESVGASRVEFDASGLTKSSALHDFVNRNKRWKGEITEVSASAFGNRQNGLLPLGQNCYY